MGDLELHAQWIMDNLTLANKELIADAKTKPKEVREILLRSQLAAIAADRAMALCDAIDRGECKAQEYPDVRRAKGRSVIADKMLSIVYS